MDTFDQAAFVALVHKLLGSDKVEIPRRNSDIACALFHEHFSIDDPKEMTIQFAGLDFNGVVSPRYVAWAQQESSGSETKAAHDRTSCNPSGSVATSQLPGTATTAAVASTMSQSVATRSHAQFRAAASPSPSDRRRTSRRSRSRSPVVSSHSRRSRSRSRSRSRTQRHRGQTLRRSRSRSPKQCREDEELTSSKAATMRSRSRSRSPRKERQRQRTSSNLTKRSHSPPGEHKQQRKAFHADNKRAERSGSSSPLREHKEQRTSSQPTTTNQSRSRSPPERLSKSKKRSSASRGAKSRSSSPAPSSFRSSEAAAALAASLERILAAKRFRCSLCACDLPPNMDAVAHHLGMECPKVMEPCEGILQLGCPVGECDSHTFKSSNQERAKALTLYARMQETIKQRSDSLIDELSAVMTRVDAKYKVQELVQRASAIQSTKTGAILALHIASAHGRSLMRRVGDW